jgi:hypothetical protein
MTIGIVLLVLPIVLLVGDLSLWPHSRMGCYPGVSLGLLPALLVVLLSAGVFQGPATLHMKGPI